MDIREVGAEGGGCLKYLQRGWNRKEERGHKNLKKRGGKLVLEVDALKKGGWNHLTNYVYISEINTFYQKSK